LKAFISLNEAKKYLKQNNKIIDINNELNKLSDSIKNYENNSQFVLNKISDESLLICDLKTVIIHEQTVISIKAMIY
jgi:hypothetical protein